MPSWPVKQMEYTSAGRCCAAPFALLTPPNLPSSPDYNAAHSPPLTWRRYKELYCLNRVSISRKFRHQQDAEWTTLADKEVWLLGIAGFRGPSNSRGQENLAQVHKTGQAGLGWSSDWAAQPDRLRTPKVYRRGRPRCICYQPCPSFYVQVGLCHICCDNDGRWQISEDRRTRHEYYGTKSSFVICHGFSQMKSSSLWSYSYDKI